MKIPAALLLVLFIQSLCQAELQEISSCGDGTCDDSRVNACGEPSQGPGPQTIKLLKYNRNVYVPEYDQVNPANRIIPPQRRVALVTCMDARILPEEIFGLQIGDIHVIRNAGGVITDDALRSLAISQTLLGTKEIIVMHHIDCGMRTFTAEEINAQYLETVGVRARWFWEEFEDSVQGVIENVRENVRRILNSPFIPEKCFITGALYDERTGEVEVIPVCDIISLIPSCDCLYPNRLDQ